MSQYKKYSDLPLTDIEKQRNEQRQQELKMEEEQRQKLHEQEQEEQQRWATPRQENNQQMTNQPPQEYKEPLQDTSTPVENVKPYNDIQNKEDFLNYLKNYRIVIVDVWADWCGPCRNVAPKFEELAKKYSNNPYMIFLKDNIDNPGTYHREFCESIPTFFIYTNGNKDGRQFSGAEFTEFSALVDKFNNHILSN